MKTYEITVADTGARFPCREDEFLLAAMVKAQCGPVRHGCFGGGCGVCKMQVASGDYAVVKRMSRAHVNQAEEQNGAVLLCCIQPRGNVTIAGAKIKDN